MGQSNTMATKNKPILNHGLSSNKLPILLSSTVHRTVEQSNTKQKSKQNKYVADFSPAAQAAQKKNLQKCFPPNGQQIERGEQFPSPCQIKRQKSKMEIRQRPLSLLPPPFSLRLHVASAPLRRSGARCCSRIATEFRDEIRLFAREFARVKA